MSVNLTFFIFVLGKIPVPIICDHGLERFELVSKYYIILKKLHFYTLFVNAPIYNKIWNDNNYTMFITRCILKKKKRYLKYEHTYLAVLQKSWVCQK